MNEKFNKRAKRLLCGLMAFIMLVGYLPDLNVFANDTPETPIEEQLQPEEEAPAAEQEEQSSAPEQPAAPEAPTVPEQPAAPEAPVVPEDQPPAADTPVVPEDQPPAPDAVPESGSEAVPEGGSEDGEGTAEQTPEQETITVTFVDENGTEIAKQVLAKGEEAVQPSLKLQSGEFSFAGWVDTATGEVVSSFKFDRDTTLRASWTKAETVAVTIRYQYENGAAALADEVHYIPVNGGKVTITPPAIDGYAASPVEIDPASGKREYLVVYCGAEAAYTVIYLKEDLEGGSYTEAGRKTLSGRIGQQAVVPEKGFEGFTAQPVSAPDISAAGTVVEVKYTRNSYLIRWETGEDGSYIQPQSVRYEAEIERPELPVSASGSFVDWTQQDGSELPKTMPAHDLTAVAKWAGNETASYTVIYWGESLEGGYDQLYSVYATGKPGEEIPSEESLDAAKMEKLHLNAEGFSFKEASGAQVIAANGQAMRNVYFDRRTFEIRFFVQEGNFWNRKWVETDRISAKYGADVSQQWLEKSAGYQWRTGENSGSLLTYISAMPVNGADAYRKDLEDTNMSVVYEIEALDGTYQFYKGVPANYSSIGPEDIIGISGFTFSEVLRKDQKSQETQPVQPGSDGRYDGFKTAGFWSFTQDRYYDAVIRYTRNSYELVLHNGSRPETVPVKYEAPLAQRVPADPERPAGVDAGYVFGGWYLDPECTVPADWSANMPARALHVYAGWFKPECTVTLVPGRDEMGGGSFAVKLYDTVSDRPELEDAMQAIAEADGFLGWYTDAQLAVPFIEGQRFVRDTTLYAAWQTSDEVTYVVVAVAKDQDGKELQRGETLSAKRGDTVTVYAPAIDGMAPEVFSQNVQLKDDHQEIVFTYTAVAGWQVIVHHVMKGETEPFADTTVIVPAAENQTTVYNIEKDGVYTVEPGPSQVVTRENPTATFIYTLVDPAKYTVRYVDAETGEEIARELRDSGVYAGQTITVQHAPETPDLLPEGYQAPQGESGLLIREEAANNLVTVRLNIRTVSYTVKYIDAKTGEEIAPRKYGSAKYGSTVAEKALTVTGYELAAGEAGEQAAKDLKEDYTFVFPYKKTHYTLTVRYVFDDDPAAGREDTYELRDGSEQTVYIPADQNYEVSVTVDGKPLTLYGAGFKVTMAGQDMEVVVTYTRKPAATYKVEFWFQDAYGSGYTLDPNKTLAHTAPAGSIVDFENEDKLDFEGFVYLEKAENGVSSGQVKEDGSLVLTRYYDRVTNPVTVTYTFAGGAKVKPVQEPSRLEAVRYGAGYSIPVPKVSGYVPSVEVVEGTMGARPVEYEVFYTPVTVSYTIRYLGESLGDGKGYTVLLGEITEEVYYGETVGEVEVKSFEGFTYASSNVNQSILEKFGDYLKNLWNSETAAPVINIKDLVSADGSLVIELYYDRLSYSVNYSYTNTPEGASALPEKQLNVKYGQTVTLPQPTAPGYNFAGWVSDQLTIPAGALTFEMPAVDLELSGSFVAAGNSSYEVKYYREELARPGYYELFRTDKIKNVKAGETVIASGIELTGYHLASDQLPSGVVSGSNTLVLEVSYARNEHTVSYHYEGIRPSVMSALPAEQGYLFGAEVKTAPQAVAPGYTFDGWYFKDGKHAEDAFEMPDEDVPLYGRFVANTDTPYTVLHHLEQADGSDKIGMTEHLTGETDSIAVTGPKTFTGYVYSAKDPRNALTGSIMADGKLVLHVWYERDSYTVRYAWDGSVPADREGQPLATLPRDESVLFADNYTVAPVIELPGYTFDGWRDGGKVVTELSMPAENVTLYGAFTANTNTKYTVEYYKEGVNGGYELAARETLTGATGDYAQAEVRLYEGFRFNNEADNTAIWGYIAGDGSLVLRLYYDRNRYGVTWRVDGETGSGFTETKYYAYGAALEERELLQQDGYVFLGWQGELPETMPAQDLVLTGEFKPDTLIDPNAPAYDPANPNTGVPVSGDGIPDEYQAIVNFAAVNGGVSFGRTVVTLYRDGALATAEQGGAGSLAANQIPNVTANSGYRVSRSTWNPAQPTTSYAIRGDMTFVVTLGAAPAAGGTPAAAPAPVPAVIPAPAAVPVAAAAPLPAAPAEEEELEDAPVPMAGPGPVPSITIRNPGEDEVDLGEEETPMAGPADHSCCILHFLLLLAALLLELLYISNVKKGQQRIFAARTQLEEYNAGNRF